MLEKKSEVVHPVLVVMADIPIQLADCRRAYMRYFWFLPGWWMTLRLPDLLLRHLELLLPSNLLPELLVRLRPMLDRRRLHIRWRMNPRWISLLEGQWVENPLLGFPRRRSDSPFAPQPAFNATTV